MLYGLLANLVLGLHLGFVLFALLGGLGALRWRWWPVLHLPAVAWGAWIEFSAGVCPLTPLENALRRRAGEAGYEGDFIQHYLLRTLYPDGLTPALQTMLGATLLLVNLIIYGLVLWRMGATKDPH